MKPYYTEHLTSSPLYFSNTVFHNRINTFTAILYTKELKIKNYGLLLLCLISTHTFGSAFTGTIKSVVCHDKTVSAWCQIRLNGQPSNPLACATQEWKYTFDATTIEGRNILSLLLAAQLSKQEVVIGGKGTCSLSSSSEDLRHVFINTPE